VIYSAASIGSPGRVILTSPRPPPDHRRAERRKIGPRRRHRAGALESGGFGTKISERIRDDIWTKLIINLGGNIIISIRAIPQALARQRLRLSSTISMSFHQRRHAGKPSSEKASLSDDSVSIAS
jgi:hypothetical protein